MDERVYVSVQIALTETGGSKFRLKIQRKRKGRSQKSPSVKGDEFSVRFNKTLKIHKGDRIKQMKSLDFSRANLRWIYHCLRKTVTPLFSLQPK